MKGTFLKTLQNPPAWCLGATQIRKNSYTLERGSLLDFFFFSSNQVVFSLVSVVFVVVEFCFDSFFLSCVEADGADGQNGVRRKSGVT